MSCEMKQLLETFQQYQEQLSKKEKKRRRNRAIFGSDPKTDWKDDEMEALGRGIILAHNPNHAGDDGKFSDGTDDGSWSSSGKQHSRKGKNKGGSTAVCGRKPRSDGKYYRCRDGSLDENELDLEPEIDAAYLKAIVEKSVNQAVRAAMASVQKQTGCSLQQCLRIVNQLNQAEDGDLGKMKKK